MPDWTGILFELQKEKNVDKIRRKYLKKLFEFTNRNTILYYSSWLTKPLPNVDINDSDMNGFMNATHSLDKSKGLDLILHTPGGNPVATESIVKYLRKLFNNDIRVIVPHMAMSAGTMIACSAKVIIMGDQSSLGPIDPQFNGIPAFNIKKEFESAKSELSKGVKNYYYWKLIIEKYRPADYNNVVNAIALSETLIKEWLGTCMFNSEIEADSKKVEHIASCLNENENSKYHGRHFNKDWCKDVGLKIIDLESDKKLQDLVLSVHHATNLTFGTTNSIKIIENHQGKAMISKAPQLLPNNILQKKGFPMSPLNPRLPLIPKSPK